MWNNVRMLQLLFRYIHHSIHIPETNRQSFDASCVRLESSESGFKCSNKHPHRCETHTWHWHILSCCFHSAIIQMDLTLNLPLTCLHDSGQDPNMSPPPTQLIILLLSYVHSCRHDSTPPIVLVVWENRQQIWCGAALHVCANVTKWKGMQIGDLITSRPLLHPVGSNVSLAEKFPACFSCTIIHLSTALRRLFFYFLHPFSNI